MANKYRARKTVVDGITFDSGREASRYVALRALLSTGLISGLEMQVCYELAPKAKLDGDLRARPRIRYFVDFQYRTKCGQVVCEDVKGMDTAVSRMKRHLMKTVHGVDVRVIR